MDQHTESGAERCGECGAPAGAEQTARLLAAARAGVDERAEDYLRQIRRFARDRQRALETELRKAQELLRRLTLPTQRDGTAPTADSTPATPAAPVLSPGPALTWTCTGCGCEAASALAADLVAEREAETHREAAGLLRKAEAITAQRDVLHSQLSGVRDSHAALTRPAGAGPNTGGGPAWWPGHQAAGNRPDGPLGGTSSGAGGRT